MTSSKRERRWRRLLAVAVVLVLVGLVAGLGFVLWIRVTPIDADTETAVALFTRVLHGEDALEAEALGSLAGAMERSPRDGRAALWFGLANMHGFLRARELPYAIRASRAFDRAVELSPEDTSAAGWRAFWRYQAGRTRGEDLARCATSCSPRASATRASRRSSRRSRWHPCRSRPAIHDACSPRSKPSRTAETERRIRAARGRCSRTAPRATTRRSAI
jgi:hypothetical protein